MSISIDCATVATTTTNHDMIINQSQQQQYNNTRSGNSSNHAAAGADDDGATVTVVVEDYDNRGVQFVKQSMTQLSIGALAGAASRTGTAPLERLKILYQVKTGQPPSVLNGLRDMYLESGWRGMWKGNGANVLKIAPESAVKLYVFEGLKKMMGDDGTATNGKHLNPTQLFICGSCSGIFSHLCFFPMEVIKTRLAVASDGVYKGIADCFLKTIRQEGLLSFYRGISASLASTIPHSGVNLMVYEIMRRMLANSDGSGGSPASLMAAGGVSAVVSQATVYPVRMIKARMIMSGMPGFRPACGTSEAAFSGGVIQIARATIKNEGFLGLYKGFYPSLLKSVPSNMIVFTVYGTLRNLFGIEKHAK